MLSLLEHCITGLFVILTIKSVDETLWGYHSSKTSLPDLWLSLKVFDVTIKVNGSVKS